MKQSGSAAVAPRGGKFAGPLVTPGATYDTRGKGTGKQQNPLVAIPFGGKGPASPFGAYCTPTTSYTASQHSLGPKFSSQSHFQSLQLLNVPQFLFSRVVRLKTAP